MGRASLSHQEAGGQVLPWGAPEAADPLPLDSDEGGPGSLLALSVLPRLELSQSLNVGIGLRRHCQACLRNLSRTWQTLGAKKVFF